MKKFARMNLSGDVFWALVEGNKAYRVVDSIFNQSPIIEQQPIDINKLSLPEN